MNRKVLVVLFHVLLVFVIGLTGASAQGPTLDTRMRYQGQLSKNGAPVDAVCDLKFSLFSIATGGTPVRTLPTVPNVRVERGLFETYLNVTASDFIGGPAQRWLEVSVSCPSGSAFTLVNPRSPVTLPPGAGWAQTAGSVAWSNVFGAPSFSLRGHNHAGEFWTTNAQTGLLLSVMTQMVLRCMGEQRSPY